MRRQDDIVEVEIAGRHLRLVREHVEPRPQNFARAQRRDQGVVVNQRAARDVDQHAVGPQRLQHLRVYDVARVGPAGRCDHQDVDGFRHADQRRIVEIGRVGLRLAAVIDHFDIEGRRALGDGLAYAPQSQHAHVPTRERRTQRKRAFFRPASGAQVGLRRRETAHRVQQQPHRGVGGLGVKHAGRMRHHHAARCRRLRVDVIVTDAEARHDLEFGELRHIGVIDLDVKGDDQRADLGRDRRERCGGVGRQMRLMQGRALRDALGDHRHGVARQQDVVAHRRCAPFSSIMHRPDGPARRLPGAYQACSPSNHARRCARFSPRKSKAARMREARNACVLATSHRSRRRSGSAALTRTSWGWRIAV